MIHVSSLRTPSVGIRAKIILPLAGVAIITSIVGITFIAAYIIYFKFLHPELNTSEHWWWGISPEGIGTVGMLLNFAMPSWSAVAPRDHHASAPLRRPARRARHHSRPHPLFRGDRGYRRSDRRRVAGVGSGLGRAPPQRPLTPRGHRTQGVPLRKTPRPAGRKRKRPRSRSRSFSISGSSIITFLSRH